MGTPSKIWLSPTDAKSWQPLSFKKSPINWLKRRSTAVKLALWPAFLLVFAFLAVSPAFAGDEANTLAELPIVTAGKPRYSAFEESDRNYKLGLLMNYVRREGPSWFPGLPDALRSPARMALQSLGSTADEFGDGVSAAANELIPSFLIPSSPGMDPPALHDAQRLWISPGYHHMGGLMPFNDAIMLGFNYRADLPNEGFKLNIHPFYGQSWTSPKGYWGVETALGIGPAGKKPWGVIVVRYDDGDSGLMDQPRGFDMHTEFSFDNNLTLNAGVRHNEDTQLGDYVLLRWRMKFGE